MGVRLFVGGLPYDVTSQSLCNFVWDWVLPQSASVITDPETVRPRGFGWITVSTPEDAAIACRANGAEMLGRRVTIKVARSHPVQAAVPRWLVTEEVALANEAVTLTLSPEELERQLLATLLTDGSCDIWARDALSRLAPDEDQWGTTREGMRRLVLLLAERPDLLPELHPRLFEHLVAALLSASGYREVKLSVPSADHGVDIYANRDTTFGRSIFLVQCKRYAPSRKVTRPDVQLTYGVLASSAATQAAIITTSSFTTPARRFLGENAHHIGGFDGAELTVWLEATAQVLVNER